MATTTGTRIEVVRNDLPKLADNLFKGARDLVRDTLLAIEGSAKSTVPIGATGDLGSGIQQGELITTPLGFEGSVVDVMEYAAYVNYGTGSRGSSSQVPDIDPAITYTGSWLGMTARPFMSQAAHEARGPFNAALNKLIHL